VGAVLLERWLAEKLGPKFGARLTQLSDAQLVRLITFVYFVCCSWFLLLVQVPPYQDYPNHLATIHVLKHPEVYGGEFVSNGLFKTNEAFFAFLRLFEGALGLERAATLFTLLVLAVTAYALPRALLIFVGRQRLLVASLFAWPLVHNWFVSMGMIDFALGFALSLLLLVELQRLREHDRPSGMRIVAVSGLGLLVWYAHAFAILTAGLLVTVEVLRSVPKKQFLRDCERLILPLVPVSVATAYSVLRHVTEPQGAMTGDTKYMRLLPSWELAYNFFAEACYGYTWLSIPSGFALVAVALAFRRFTLGKAHAPVPFFSGPALVVLAVAYFFVPHSATNWYHMNSRLILFLWFCVLVRVPSKVHPLLPRIAPVAFLLYSFGMAVDTVRLDRERQVFTDGIEAVPMRAKLLPFVFRPKVVSENTRNILHLWGYYTVAKSTSAPLAFAHSRGFPMTYGKPPITRLNHIVLEAFTQTMKSPAYYCQLTRDNAIVTPDCRSEYATRWRDFWVDAEPAYDHVLMWGAHPDAIAALPKSYVPVYEKGLLSIYRRPALEQK
jgi:hypothetical protein